MLKYRFLGFLGKKHWVLVLGICSKVESQVCLIQAEANSSDASKSCETFAICLCETTPLTPLTLLSLYLKNVEEIYTSQKSCWLINYLAVWGLAFRRVSRFLRKAISTCILLAWSNIERSAKCPTNGRSDFFYHFAYAGSNFGSESSPRFDLPGRETYWLRFP